MTKEKAMAITMACSIAQTSTSPNSNSSALRSKLVGLTQTVACVSGSSAPIIAARAEQMEGGRS